MWWRIPLAFACLKISFSILNDNIPGLSIHDCKFFFSSPLWLYHATSFWFMKFLLKNLLIVFIRSYFSLAAFNILLFVFNFWHPIIMYLGVGLFGFILFEALHFFALLEKCSAIIFLLLSLFFSPSGDHIIWMLVCDVVPYVP